MSLNCTAISLARMRERFSGAQIEGHAGPAPVFHEAFERDIGFSRGIRIALCSHADSRGRAHHGPCLRLYWARTVNCSTS